MITLDTSQRSEAQAKRRRSPLFWLFAAFVLATVAWVLSLPVFPSQDGPLHLYYANIMRHTLFGTPGEYSRLFYVRDLLPPYALYYYALIALGTIMPLEWADKTIVCGAIVLFAFGFRFLTGQVMRAAADLRSGSSRSEAPAFLVLPILLNWPLMMGFVNFYLCLALGLFALGLWCRGSRAPLGRYDHRGRILFVLLLYVMMLTHAMPLLLVLIFCFYEIAMRALPLVLGRVRASARWRPLGYDLLYALAGCTAFLYIRLFLIANPMVQSQPDSFARLTLGNVTTYLHGKGLLVFANNAPATMAYRAGIFAVLLAALLLAAGYLVRSLRSHVWSEAETWIVFALGFLLALPFIPRDFNGAHYFALRLATVVSLFVAVAASVPVAALARRRDWRAPGLVTLCAAASVCTLALAFARLSPIAASIATLDRAPSAATERPGLMLRANGETLRTDIAWDPYFWAGVHYFRRNNLLLYNSPWLLQSQIPVKPRPGVALPLEPSFDEETPSMGARYLETDAQQRRELARVGYLLVMRDGAPPDQNALAAENGDDKPVPAAQGWQCTGRGIYSLCLPPAGK